MHCQLLIFFNYSLHALSFGGVFCFLNDFSECESLSTDSKPTLKWCYSNSLIESPKSFFYLNNFHRQIFEFQAKLFAYSLQILIVSIDKGSLNLVLLLTEDHRRVSVHTCIINRFDFQIMSRQYNLCFRYAKCQIFSGLTL